MKSIFIPKWTKIMLTDDVIFRGHYRDNRKHELLELQKGLVMKVMRYDYHGGNGVCIKFINSRKPEFFLDYSGSSGITYRKFMESKLIKTLN